MSSHHVVKEAQEPALLVLQAEALAHAHITPLLEWSPTIIVAADALAEVLELGIKIDAVVFSREQRDDISRMARGQEPVSFIELNDHEHALSGSLQHLAARGHTAVNILTPNSPIEQEEVKRKLAEEVSFNVVLLNSYLKSALCRPGKFVKWYPAGEKIEVQPALKEVRISTSGFTANLHQALINKNIEVQTASSGIVSISGDAPWWLIEQLG